MNREPDPTAEYVLAFDLDMHEWHPERQAVIPRGTVVVNVHVEERLGYVFTVKETSLVTSTHYGNMLAENTAKNLKRLEAAHKKRDAYFAAKKALRQAFKRVNRLGD